MKAEVVDLGPCRKRISVELEAAKVKEQYDTICLELGREAELPGFRRGRVPRSLLTSKFGKQIVADAKSKLIEASFRDVVKDKALEPVGEPVLDLDKVEFSLDKALSYQCEIEVKPVFDPPSCEGLKLERPSDEVTDEDVAKTLKNILRRLAEVHPVSEPAQNEDIVVIEARLTVDGKEAWRDQELPVALMEERVLGLPFDLKSSELLGAKAGDRRSLTVELPVNFRIPEYAGKSAQAEIELKDVKRPKLPELTDELAKKLGAESAEKLRASLRERLVEDKKSSADEAVRSQAIDKLVAAVQFELPEKLLARACAGNEARRHYRLAQMGINGETLTDEARQEMHNVSRKDAERELRAFLILEKLAKKLGMEASDAEVDGRLAEMAARRGVDPVAFRRHAEEHGEIESVKAELAERKVIDFVVSKAQIGKAAAGAKS
ncbi:MAG TPA: trigger factor [Planctomycetota bacterium]|nr:trigger factor [Planctomycetota bacterium]